MENEKSLAVLVHPMTDSNARILWQLENATGSTVNIYGKIPILDLKIPNIERIEAEYIFLMNSLITLEDQITFIKILLENSEKEKWLDNVRKVGLSESQKDKLLVITETDAERNRLLEQLQDNLIKVISLEGQNDLQDNRFNKIALMPNVYFRELEILQPDLFRLFEEKYEVFSLKTQVEVVYDNYEIKVIKPYVNKDRLKTKDEYLRDLLKVDKLIRRTGFFNVYDINKIISGIKEGYIDFGLLEEIAQDLDFSIWDGKFDQPAYFIKPIDLLNHNKLGLNLNGINLIDEAVEVCVLLDYIIDDYKHLRIEDILELEMLDERILFYQILLDYMYFSKIFSDNVEIKDDWLTDLENEWDEEDLQEKIENYYYLLESFPEELEKWEIPTTKKRQESYFYKEKDLFIDKYQSFLNTLLSLRGQKQSLLDTSDKISLKEEIKKYDPTNGLLTNFLRMILEDPDILLKIQKADNIEDMTGIVSTIVLDLMSSHVLDYLSIIEEPNIINRFVEILLKHKEELINEYREGL